MTKKTIIINTFSTAQSPGSKQFLHLFENASDKDLALLNIDIKDEYDHSFVYLNNATAHVTWRNKAGVIQFCGSGAYATAWYFCLKRNMNTLTIKNDYHCLTASVNDNQNLMLKISKRNTGFFKEEKTYRIFTEKNSGVYLIEFFDIEKVTSVSFDQLYEMIGNQEDIHSVCVFYWDKKQARGYLNYYTPRYGRNQDYVTGSIHQYLAGLLQEREGAQNQYWTQLSSSPGELNINCGKDHVELFGLCNI
jgi:predicted PhzF superfamily epimerase YddE/YHI9